MTCSGGGTVIALVLPKTFFHSSESMISTGNNLLLLPFTGCSEVVPKPSLLLSGTP